MYSIMRHIIFTTVGAFFLLALPVISSTVHANGVCTDEQRLENEKFKQQDYVIKAGEEFVLNDCPIRFKSLTIEEGGKVLFSGRLIVTLREIYEQSRPELEQVNAFRPLALEGRKRVFTHVCVESMTTKSKLYRISANRLYDFTKSGAFVKSDAGKMTLDDYLGCRRFVRPIEINFTRRNSLYPDAYHIE